MLAKKPQLGHFIAQTWGVMCTALAWQKIPWCVRATEPPYANLSRNIWKNSPKIRRV